MLGTLRRVVAGIVLIVVGVPFAMQSPLGLVLVAGWGASGLALLAGKPWSRNAGLVASGVGLSIGAVLATAGVGSPLAEVLFSSQDAVRWYVVQPLGYVVLIFSGIAGTLLLRPFTQTVGD
jgi:hypothetical protein